MRRLGGPLGVIAPLVVALGMFFSQIVQLSHFFLVDHAVCEHGDFVHGDSAKHEVEATRAGTKDQGLQSSDPGDKGDHEHCDARAVRHHAAEIGPSLAEATLLALIDIPEHVAHPERRPVAPLSLAPKSSPPSA